MRLSSGGLLTITLIYNHIVCTASHVGTGWDALATRARHPDCVAQFGHPNRNGCELALASLSASMAPGQNSRLATVLSFGSFEVVGTGRNSYPLPRNFAATNCLIKIFPVDFLIVQSTTGATIRNEVNTILDDCVAGVDNLGGQKVVETPSSSTSTTTSTVSNIRIEVWSTWALEDIEQSVLCTFGGGTITGAERQQSDNACPDRVAEVAKACSGNRDDEGSCDVGFSCQQRQYIKDPGLLWGSITEALLQVGLCLVKTTD
ncbi:MAG: hypothetical protein M1812_001884 [Candelaria pacifica]|nr:MAG: hypothetical protein M1812_001884 [Candelaria pacifica]